MGHFRNSQVILESSPTVFWGVWPVATSYHYLQKCFRVVWKLGIILPNRHQKMGKLMIKVRFPSFSPFCPHFLMDIKSGRNLSHHFPSPSIAKCSSSSICNWFGGSPPQPQFWSDGSRSKNLRWGSWRSGGNSIGTWISPLFSGPWAHLHWPWA